MKSPALHRWVCLPCRFSVKRRRVDVRALDRPSYVCPRCRAPMVWSGTAFRPPPRDDDEAWQVAAAILAAGVRFDGKRTRRYPRTLAEVAPWLDEEREERWLPERPLTIAPARAGLRVRVGARVLANYEPVLVHADGDWRAGRIKLTGDGGKPLTRGCVIVPGRVRAVPLTERTRLRVRG